MGSKTSAVGKTKRKYISCRECPSKFLNRTILEKHILKMHKKERAYSVQSAKGNKNMASTAGEQEQKPVTLSKVAITTKKVKPNKSALSKTPPQIEAKCHVCRKLFKSRLEMLNHYRATHLPSPRIVETKDDMGIEKLLDAAKKPTQDQSKCVTCSKIFATRKSMLLHVCKNSDGSKELYRCSGCKKKFRTLDQVDEHVVTDHDDKMEVLVFNDEIEFETWKKKEQNSTRIRYITMSRADSSNKVFRCAAVIKGDVKDNLKDICPSSIILRSDNNLLKATFYKKHYGHPHVEIVSDHEESTQLGTELDTSKTSSKVESCTDVESKDMEPEDFKMDSHLKCLGCCNSFNSVKNIYLHLNNVHNDDIYSILIPSDAEFREWKTKMEQSTSCRYSARLKINQNTYYVCAAVIKPQTTIDERGQECVVQGVCPSTIVTKFYNNSIQVHFYKVHYGHEHKQYVPTNDLKKYDIKSMFYKISPERSRPPKNESLPEYKKLKSMLLDVVSTAGILKLDKVKLLLAEAEEIMTAARAFLEEDRKENQKAAEKGRKVQEKKVIANALKRKMDVGDQIESENLRTSKRIKGRLSRDTGSSAKVTPVESAVKKATQKPKSPAIITTNIPISKQANVPKIVNTFSLAVSAQTEEKNDKATDDKELDMNGTSRDENQNRNIDKEDVKKMTPIISKKYEPLQTLSSFNDSYKTFIESKNWVAAQTGKREKSETPKGIGTVNVKKNNKKMKTKLGQFSPKHKTKTKSPITTPSPVKTSTPPVLGKIKVERYEVKERENDCNILILKI